MKYGIPKDPERNTPEGKGKVLYLAPWQLDAISNLRKSGVPTSIILVITYYYSETIAFLYTKT